MKVKFPLLKRGISLQLSNGDYVDIVTGEQEIPFFPESEVNYFVSNFGMIVLEETQPTVEEVIESEVEPVIQEAEKPARKPRARKVVPNQE